MNEGAPPPDPTPRVRSDQGPFAPRAVFEDEWARIRKPRRGEAGIVGEADGPGPPSHLVGLALSGGGVRSATFALGILQCFADLGMLRVFDYLSTVSGGGFTGGWWSAWLSRTETIGKGLFPLEERVEPARTEGRLALEGRGAKVVDGSCHAHGDPIHHLRLFSNYLTPRKGTLSGDTWRAAAVISRNLVLTWIILLPLLFAAILLGKPLLFTASHPAQLYGPGLSEPAVLSQRLLIAALFPAAMFAWTTVVSIVWLILHRKESFASVLGLLAAGALLAFFLNSVAERHPVRVGRVVQAVAENWLAALGWAVVAAFLVIGIVVPERDAEVKRHRAVRYHATLLVMIVVLSVVLLVSGFGHELVAWVWKYSRDRLPAQVARAGGWLAVVAAVGGAVFTAFKGAPAGGRDRRDTGLPSLPSRVIFALTPPLVLAVLAVVSAGAANWVVRQLYRPEHPGAPHYVTWLGLVVCTGYAVLELAEASQRSGTPWWRIKRNWWVIAATLFTIAICVPTGAQDTALRLWLAGVAAFALFLWFLASAVRTRDGAARAWWLLALAALAMVARQAFLLAARTLPGETVAWAYANAAAVAAILVLVVALGWSADPNVLSLHTFYKARLVRAYLGASNARRATSAAEITEAVAGDNVRLSAVDGPSRGGPYHLVNTTLNLVGGRDLSTVQRSAASFVLSPLYCGSSRTGYRRTREYMTDEMTLGTALAISGAAASPNMGSITPSAALAMLMTLVNVRLGYWAPTPNRGDWKDPQARLWPVYMLREFLSQTTELSSYCYLTDGGHFDNTGLYSLVERGCRYIVLADCGADPKPCFEDLGNAIRRCRIDFGTEFDLDLTPLRDDTPADGRRHCIVGRLRYTRAHADTLGWAADDDDRHGILVVIKPTIARAASADVRQYALENSAFPQQTTSDQWYDEAQFESYRKLGYDSAGSAFAGLTSLGALTRRGVSSADVAAIFVELQAREPGG